MRLCNLLKTSKRSDEFRRSGRRRRKKKYEKKNDEKNGRRTEGFGKSHILNKSLNMQNTKLKNCFFPFIFCKSSLLFFRQIVTI